MAKIKRKINKAKRIDGSCRNNKGCPHCIKSRLHNSNKRLKETFQQIKENEKKEEN